MYVEYVPNISMPCQHVLCHFIKLACGAVWLD